MPASARSRSLQVTPLAVGLLALATGCVHVYQPLSSLHRPIVVDTQAPNFQDLRLSVICPPDKVVSRGEAEVLCDRVGKLFELQGATVTTSSGSGIGDGDLEDELAATQAAVAPTTDLVLELRTRQTHFTNDALSWILCIGTATMVPAYSESTFAQDVVVRDSTGFLLASDTLEGRIVRTFGFGTWAGNKVLDWVWRKKEEELSTKQVYAEVSSDLYGQLSQLVFNAKMRWQVLEEATPTGRATSTSAAPADAKPATAPNPSGRP